jgi:hypothetical protein
VQSFTLSAIFLHDNTATAYNLARVALAINFAQASPGSEDLGIPDFDQVNFVLSAKRLNELDVFCLVAGLVKDAQVGLALVEGFRGFTETTGKTIMNESVLQNLLQTSVSLNSGLPEPHT